MADALPETLVCIAAPTGSPVAHPRPACRSSPAPHRLHGRCHSRTHFHTARPSPPRNLRDILYLPRSPAIESPRGAFRARRSAHLLHHADPRIRGIHRTVVSLAIIRRAPHRPARNGLVPIPAAISIASAHAEVRAASFIYPDPTLIKTPRPPLRAWRPAPLLGHLHAVMRVGRAVVPPAIIRRAGDRLPTIPTRPGIPRQQKVCATPPVHPDAPVVISPRLVLDARRPAALLHHLYPGSRLRVAVMPLAIVRLTRNSLLRLSAANRNQHHHQNEKQSTGAHGTLLDVRFFDGRRAAISHITYAESPAAASPSISRILSLPCRSKARKDGQRPIATRSLCPDAKREVAEGRVL